jgi:hypothetical protein
MKCAGNSGQTCGGTWAISVYQLVSGTSTTTPPTTTTTTTTTTTSTTTTSTTTTSTSTPAASKVVVAHYMVGNTYSYSQSTWSSNIQAAMAGGINGFALNVGIDSWQPQRVSDAHAAASGTSFKLFLSFDMTCVPVTSSITTSPHLFGPVTVLCRVEVPATQICCAATSIITPLTRTSYFIKANRSCPHSRAQTAHSVRAI